MKKSFASAALALSAVALLAGPAASQDESMTIVASASPIYDVASTIGGSDSHTVDAVQTDMFGDVPASKEAGVREADLVFRIAEGVQPRFDAAIERLAPGARVIDVGTSFPDMRRIDQPYLWQDPANMMAISEIVRRELTNADPSEEKGFRDRQMGWVQNMADLERIHLRTLESCERPEFVTTDPSFAWYSDRFDIGQVAADPSNPRPALNSVGATTLFSDQLVGLDTAQERLNDWGIRSAVLDPMKNRTDQARRGGGSYSVSMGLNLDALRNGMDCEEISLVDD